MKRAIVATTLWMLGIACSGNSQKGPSDEGCQPSTCQSLGLSCGVVDDGCGHSLDCGACATGCEPQACEDRCGMQDDGCGKQLDCGACNECQPITCDMEGACGMLPNGCGELIDCGRCPEDCEPESCEAGACGMQPDGCGQMLNCGACECDAEVMTVQRHAQGAASSGFPNEYDAYAELYDLPCASVDDCVVGCEERGGTEAMCAASECIMSIDTYCLPATVWTNLTTLRAEGTETSDGAQLVLVSDPYHDFLLLNDFKFEVPENAEIVGITATVRRTSGSPDVAVDGAVRLIKGGQMGSADRSEPTPWPSGEYVNAEYGGADDLWGETWTPADVNSPDFGVALSTIYTQSAGNGRAYVDIVYASIHYRLCE